MALSIVAHHSTRMTHTIGKLHRPTRTVALTVHHNGLTITRPVNACFDANDRHDLQATRTRAAAVARGIKHKIDIGVIT